MKKAFSLIELLIVVMIVGVVYTLAISSFESLKKDDTKPTLLNLKEYLMKIEHKREVKLLCLDSCESCLVFVDNEVNKEVSEKFDDFIDKDIKSYTYNVNTGLQEVAKSVFFNSENVSEDVCFSMRLDKKGVSSQVVVEYKKNFYDFTTYLIPTKKYASTQDFIDAKQKEINEVLQ